MKVGLVLGLINEKMNQMADLNKSENKSEEEVVHGDANMLMKM